MLRHPPKVSSESATLGNSTFHFVGPGVRDVWRGVDAREGGLDGGNIRAGGMVLLTHGVPLEVRCRARESVQSTKKKTTTHMSKF